MCAPALAFAQAGPPFFTNDPGTPGNANWEINIASAQSIGRGSSAYQVPQIDLNYGLGDRVQLTYEIPYVVQTSSGEPRQSGKTYKIDCKVVEGIEADKAKVISKKIRDEGPKGVQAQIQGDQLRVTAKKKDDLQTVIALLKGADFDIALQFTNYR